MDEKNDIATAAAMELAKKTQATAEALASAKIQSDITAAVLSADIGYIKKDIQDIKQTLKDLSLTDKQYVLKSDFEFWRNILISGMFLTVVISSLIKIFGN